MPNCVQLKHVQLIYWLILVFNYIVFNNSLFKLFLQVTGNWQVQLKDQDIRAIFHQMAHFSRAAGLIRSRSCFNWKTYTVIWLAFGTTNVVISEVNFSLLLYSCCKNKLYGKSMPKMHPSLLMTLKNISCLTHNIVRGQVWIYLSLTDLGDPIPVIL